MSIAISGASVSFSSSVPIFEEKGPNAAGNRAEWTLSGVSTLPNCLRVK